MTRSLIGALLLASAVAAPVQAQTTDPLYRSWEWVEEPSSARAAALGGAVAAAASDATSGAFSPAWLSLASETDLRLSVGWHDSGSVASDRVESGWRLTSGAVALPVGLNRGLAAYYRAPRSLDLGLQPVPLPDGSSDEGRLRATARETGVAFGTALTPRLRVGVRLGAAHLDLDGEATTSGIAPRTSTSTGGSWEPSVGASVLFAANQRLFASLNWDREIVWRADRRGDTGPDAHDLVAPSRVAAGLLFRPSSVVWLSGQLDWVRWSQVSEALVSPADRSPTGEFSLDHAFDGRFGLELRGEYGDSPLWNRAVLRLGLHLRSRGLLDYTGADPVEQARYGASSHATDWSLGAAFGPVEMAWIWRQPSNVWVIGARKLF